MTITKKYLDALTYKTIGCAIEVHRQLGPGLLESVYEKCFVCELNLQGISCHTQVWVPIHYKGIELNTELRVDVIVEDILCVELKAQECLLPIHEAVLLSYMKMLEKPKGVLINFNSVNIFKFGQKTMVNDLYALLPGG